MSVPVVAIKRDSHSVAVGGESIFRADIDVETAAENITSAAPITRTTVDR